MDSWNGFQRIPAHASILINSVSLDFRSTRSHDTITRNIRRRSLSGNSARVCQCKNGRRTAPATPRSPEAWTDP